MPETFRVTSAMPSQRLEAGTTVIDTMVVTAITEPSGVSLTVEVDKAGEWQVAAREALGAEAAKVAELFGA